MSSLRSIAALGATLAAGLILVAPAAPAAAVQAAQPTVVNAVPATVTPDVNDGVVYAIGQSGSTVVFGGSFTSVSPHASGTTTSVTGVAAFTAGAGTLVAGFHPSITGGNVLAVTGGPVAGTVYVAGSFKSVDGVTTKLALVSTVTGALVPGWRSPAINAEVDRVVLSHGRLFVGGKFSSVNGATRGGLAVLDPATGALSTYPTPAFTGHHNYGRNCDPTKQTCAQGGIGIKAFDITPDGSRMVAIGNFTSVGGSPRDQIAVLDLGTAAATVTASWATAAYTSPCAVQAFDSYVRDVQYSPDGSYFVVVDTGGGGTSGKNSDGTQTSCDTAARFETSGTGSDVRPTWIDYTGNDTFWSVAVTGAAVYAGGHERWVNNSHGSDNAQEGAVPRPGIAGFDPVNGMPVSWNPGRQPRGAGAYALLATADGLYVGSDTDWIGNFAYQHRKIAFFPLSGGKPLPANTLGTLPGRVFLVGQSAAPSSVRSVTWDGGSGTPGAPVTVGGTDWGTVRGAFDVNGVVYEATSSGSLLQRSFSGTTFGPTTTVDPYDDPVWSNVSTGSGQTYRGVPSNFAAQMSSLTSLFYSGGRIYYTLAGKSHMFWRWFETDSGVTGSDEFTTTDGLDWSHVAGAFISGTRLYFADSGSHNLLSVPFTGGQAAGTPSLANSSMDWTSHGAFL